MTVRKDELNPLDVLYQACTQYPGGVDGLAQRLGVDKFTLYKKLQTSVQTHRVGFPDELSTILHCLSGAGVAGWVDVLHALAYRHGAVVVAIPECVDMCDAQLSSAICGAVAQQGQAVQAIGAALAGDGVVSADELTNIELEIGRAMGALATLRERVRGLHFEARRMGRVR